MLTETVCRRTYLAAVWALMVLIAGGALCNGLFFIAQPYQLNYGEGLAAWQAAHVTDPAHTYAPIDRYPFLVFQYPPLFHLATRAVGTVTPDFLAAGRTVSVASAALLCFLLGWIAFRALPRRAASLGMRILAGVFAATLPAALYNFNWTWFARVDTLGILLSFAGLAVFAAKFDSIPGQMLACVLMLAAIFTRQTLVSAPLAIILVAFLMDRRIALRMSLILVLLGGAVLGWLVWWSHGQALLHLFRYNQTAFSIPRAMVGVLRNARSVAGPLILAAAASIAILRRAWSLGRRGQWRVLGANLRANRYRRSVILLAIYSILAALSTLANGKEGSDVNYFLEWNLSLTPLAGIFLLRLMPAQGDVWRLRPAGWAALALPLLILNMAVPAQATGWIRFFAGPLPADRQQADEHGRALALVEAAPGPVFSEDMNLLYKAGKEIPAEPAMIQCLAKAGMWDERPFVAMIRDRQFALIIAMLNRATPDRFSRERYSPAVARAIEETYEQNGMVGDYILWRPRGR